jgi:hypothetical protein
MSLVVLQRGHVPRTSGATGAPGEQQYAIATAELCVPAIRALGHSVSVIDADVPDSSYRGDIFFALHWDASTNPTASGASVGYQSSEGLALAAIWKQQYKRAGWTRAFKPDNYTAALAGYYGVRKAVSQGNRTAIITEAGFVTNSHDKAMMSPSLTALSIVNTVRELFGSAPAPAPAPVEEEDMKWLRVDDDGTGECGLFGPGYWKWVDDVHEYNSVVSLHGQPRNVSRAVYDQYRSACLHGQRCPTDAPN